MHASISENAETRELLIVGGNSRRLLRQNSTEITTRLSFRRFITHHVRFFRYNQIPYELYCRSSTRVNIRGVGTK